MSRIKLLFLITKATQGGAQKYVYDLATHLPQDRFETAVAYGEPGRLSKDLDLAHIRTIEIPSLQRDVLLFSDIRSFFEILRVLRAERPNILHLNSSKAAALGAFAGRLLGVKKIVFTTHGWPFGERRGHIAKVLIWNVSWFTALLSHAVICVSEYDLARARRMPFVSRRALRIYPGDEVAIEYGDGAYIRSAFPVGVRITGTIGELTRNKNQRALIEEAARRPDLYVAIIGEGEDRAMLESLVRECGLEARVKFFGFLPAKDALRGFDAFALPSLKEGLPYVLIEARRAGLPIEANRVGGVPEIVDANNLDEFTLKTMLEKTQAVYFG